MMNINNFEKYIEKKIISRGKSYYNSGSVLEVERLSMDKFGALVEGTDDYNVTVEIDRKLNVVFHTCDCPYDWGDVCKHVVAVLFELRNNNAHFNMDAPDLASLLDEVDETELRKFVLDMLMTNGELRRDFKETFIDGKTIHLS